MAFSGQISWQQKQVMQVSGSTWGRLSPMDKADTGHCSMQVPQPVHQSGLAWGRNERAAVDEGLDGLVVKHGFTA